ncbi:tetratricopeptide repeat protein [Candidatus Pollutiaquabacter sp.]|uniref:tetratricopeptide repeat protein n=1 Tax=Candidatus Pollutiaquabacter sp. TaxID=3416354 RepID=UPI003C8AA0CB|nr:tetratricopeptide repeat protein [Bacteroidota bacterium]
MTPHFRQRLLRSLACLTLLAVFFVGGTSTVTAQQNTDRQLAEQYLNSSEFEKAAELYDRLFDKDPFLTYGGYLRALLALKRFEDAEKLVKKMTRKSPENPQYLVDLGFVYEAAGSGDKAKGQYDKAIRSLKPDQGYVMMMGSAFTQRQQWDYALQVYQYGQKSLREQYGFFFESAEVFFQKGDAQGMIDQYLDAVADNPQMQQNILNILQARVGYDPENGRADVLRQSLLRRIQKNPDQPVYAEMLIWLFIQQKDFSSAFIQAKALDKRLREDGTRVITLGNLAMANQQYDAAIQCYEYVVSKGPDNGQYLPARMELLQARNRKLTSGNTYTRAELVQLESDYLSTLNELGRTGRTAQLVRGLAHLRAFYLDQPDSAASDLEAAIDLPGISRQSQAECKLELGDILLFIGNVWDSDLLYAQVDKDFKNDPLGQEAKFRSARLDYFRGDFLWAQSQLDVLQSATSQLIANDALALSLLISDNIGLDSTYDALNLYARADLLEYRNKQNDAMAVLDSLLKEYPDHSLVDEAWFKMAEIEDQRRNWSAEDSLYKEILQRFPESVLADDALYRRAELYENKLKDTTKAMELYQELLTNYPGSLFAADARKRYRALRGDLVN